MATSVNLNGVTYSVPSQGDSNWGSLSTYLIALSTGMLTKAGGSFTLTAEADFGATYGLKSAYFKSRNTPSTTGILRLGNNESVAWRNVANSADIALLVNASNELVFNSQEVPTKSSTATLTNKTMSGASNTFTDIGYSSLVLTDSIVNADVSASAAIAYSKLNLATSIVNADVNASAAIAYSKLNLSGSIVNADVSGSAAIAYSKLNLSGSLLNADVSASAAIALSKLAATTASRALVSDASGFVSAASVTSTELGYVSGVTSAIQTQIDTKAAKASPTFSGTILLQNSSGAQPELHFSEDPDSGTNVVKIKAPATLGADYTLTLPTDDGNANQVLATDGSGVLSWASPFVNPLTTTGDIVYASDGSGTPARLAIGASGTVLKGGTTPSWAAIVNADVDAAAAIAGTKIVPDFGGQNVATTGTLSSSNATIAGGSGSTLILKKSTGASLSIWADNTGSSNVGSLDNNSGSLRVLNNAGTVNGSITQNGLWTLGASGGTQTHVVNGNLSFTNGNLTITKASGSGSATLTGSSLSGGQGVTWSTTSVVNGVVGIGQVGVLNNNAGGASDRGIGYLYMTDAEGDGVYVYHEDGTLYLTSTYTNLGTTSATVVGTQTSDERLKDDIRPLDYGLSEVLRLSPIRYEMNNKVEIGFGAQTTESIIPEAVFYREDMERYGMDYVRIIPVLVNAIKELHLRIEELEIKTNG